MEDKEKLKKVVKEILEILNEEDKKTEVILYLAFLSHEKIDKIIGVIKKIQW